MTRLLAAFLMLSLAACTGGKLPETPESAALDISLSAPVTPLAGRAETRAYSAIVVDVNSGRILHDDDADDLRYPASLTKMMTLFMLFEEIEAGRLSMGSLLQVSANAASQPPAKIGVSAGEPITVEQAVRALAVKSANDVAVVVAENLAGSEAAFARRMTAMAETLGMTRTRFVNASGLPDSGQISTARDMAILGRALKQRHSRLCRYFALREFEYKGRTFRATNRLLGKVRGVDGMKTGYIRNSGYNLAASAKRGRKSIIVVLMGGRTGKDRNDRVEALVEKYL